MQNLILKSGAMMPALGLGTWKLRGTDGIHSVRTALDMGYRHIDTAAIYENEEAVGDAVKAWGKREQAFITTKLWMDRLSTKQVPLAFAESLKKLKTEYVDLLLIHWPSTEVPLAETLGAMMKLKEQGKVRDIGVSNFTVPLMKEAIKHAPIACNQVEYHVMLNQKPVLDFAQSNGIAVTAYSPLGRGDLADHTTLQRIAQKHHKNAGQVALRWLIEQKGVAAIPKAASEKNQKANLEIFNFVLDAEDKKALDALSGNNRLVDPDWAPKWDAA